MVGPIKNSYYKVEMIRRCMSASDPLTKPMLWAHGLRVDIASHWDSPNINNKNRTSTITNQKKLISDLVEWHTSLWRWVFCQWTLSLSNDTKIA